MNDKIECPWCGIFGSPRDYLKPICGLKGKREWAVTCENCGAAFILSFKEEEKENGR